MVPLIWTADAEHERVADEMNDLTVGYQPLTLRGRGCAGAPVRSAGPDP